MSRLDYATIIIVVVCLVAAGFLLFKTYNMFTDNGETEQTEEPFPNTPQEEEPYYYDTSAYNNSYDTTAYEEPATTYEEPSSTTPQSYNSDSFGSYMVLAGTFSDAANAETYAKKLRDMGYSNAQVEPFDKGTYDVVLVDRFSNYSDASALVQRLKNDGIDSYVKRKGGATAGVKE